MTKQMMQIGEEIIKNFTRILTGNQEIIWDDEIIIGFGALDNPDQF